MGYPNTGSEGTVVSWGSANFYSTLLAAVSGFSVSLRMNGEDIDIKEYNTYVYSTLSGLSEWDATLEAYGFATPRLGNVGTVTWGSGGYVLHAYEWELTIETEQVHDITELGSTPTNTLWKSWRPDSTKWTGRIRCRADSATALVVPHQPGTALPTLALVYGDDIIDHSLTGAAARISQVGVAVRRGALTEADYSFTGSGALTPAGTSGMFGSTAFGLPLWSEGGSAAGAIVIDTKSSSTRKTLSGADSFWKSMTLRCAVGEAVSLSVDIQGTGALTPS